MHADPKPGAEAVERLVRRAQDGDRDAFTQLVDAYKGKIYNYVLRMLGDPDTAEDVAQEAFIKAYSSLVDFRGASSFQTWLYRIAGNLAIDTMRRRKYRQGTYSLDQPLETGDGEVERDIEDERAGPERELQSAELRERVDEAILKLSPKLRTVILLYELQGLSYEDIARIVGAPLGTVKSRLFNAREQLKRMLAEDVELTLRR
jgi:RNA polymerase sigma-70 factor (ECF subfamily)